MTLAPAALLAVLLQAGGAGAESTAGEQLEYGKELYFSGQYGEALFALEEIARETETPAATRVLALKYAAYCYFVLGSKEQAREAWQRLLALDPDFRMDPVEVSPEFVDFFASIERKPTAPTDPNAFPEPPKTVKPIKPGRGCGIFLCLVPFGVGQYANRKVGKGLVFTALELVSLGLNAGFYWSLRSEREKYGGYRDEVTADRLYVLQHVFFGLFVATSLYGVIDAFVFYD